MNQNNIRTLRTVTLEGDPPTEIRIFSFGPNESSKGTSIFDAASAVLVMEDYKLHGTELAFDYEHQILANPPVEAPAAGWFTLEVRGDGSKPEDGLYATNIRWTEKASAYLKAREYRYFSPTFFHDENGRVTGLINVALTNWPATHNLTPLMAASQMAPKDTRMLAILKHLGLKPEATEAEALNALTTRDNEILTLTGKPTQAEALGVVQAWKAGAEQVATLSAEVTALKADAEKRERDSLIAQGKADKKLTPALEAWAQSQPLAALKAFLAVAPTVAALSAPKAKEPVPANAKPWGEMTPKEKASLFKNDRATYEALKAASNQ